MRGTAARSTTAPGRSGDMTPACPTTETLTRRSRQGRTALGALPSTKEFTHSRLTLDDRKLILFLLVCLADDGDSLTATYQRLLEVYGDREGHWCANKDVKALRGMASKFLGRGAESTPTWDRIVDMLNAVLPSPRRECALVRAASLYSRARRRDRPTRDYAGLITPPAWIDEPDVTVEMIRADLACADKAEPAAAPAFTGLTSPPPTPDAGTGAIPEPVPESVPAAARLHPSDDPEALLEVLWTVVSEYRQQVLELDYARKQRDQAQQQVQKLRAENWHLRADNLRINRVAEQLLREQHPSLPAETIRLLVEERAENSASPRPPKPRTLHGC
jgi:hypothetical protein